MKDLSYINDSIHGLIPISDIEKEVISSSAFNRLHDIYQNSTVYLTFPSNRTKRFEHSLGTMKLCSDMFYFSLLNSNKKNLNDFIESFARDINLDFMEEDIFHSKFLNLLLPNTITKKKHKKVYFVLIQSIRLAALLHDIGHPPFSHVIENVLSDIYKKLENNKTKNNKTVKEYIKCIKKFKKNGKPLHEEIGIYIVDKYIRKSIIKKYSNSKELINLIFNIIENIYNENNDIYRSLHSIIDSSLDGDRLDYLTRDYINSGIDNGIINYTRIISDMKLIYDNSKYKFCFPIKSLSAIEDVLQRRFNLYKNILYHHRVIKTNFLLSNSIENLIESHFEDDCIKSNEDYSKYSNDVSGLWKLLLNKKYISQWNDAWVFNLLKSIYFNGSISQNIKDSIEELIINKRHYHSLIKRIEDFKIIDDSRIEVINTFSKDKKFKLEYILIGDLKSDDIKNENYYIKNGFCISEYLIRAKEIIENIEDDIKKLFPKKDYYIIFLDKSVGISKEINLFKNTDTKNSNDELFKFKKISNMANIINYSWKYFPSLYIYTKEDYKDYNKKIKNLKYIGEKIWRYIFIKLIDINK